MDLVSQLNRFIEKNIGKPAVIEKAILNAKKNQSSFQAMNNYLRDLQKVIKPGEDNKLKLFLKNHKEETDTKYKKIYENLKRLLKNKNTVLTISNSRTVLEVIKIWHLENKNMHVIISESRPMNEGREIAKSLLKEGIKVTFITDFSIPGYISKTDAVIIGTDSILKNGDAVNKIGSRAAAIICRYYKKPFYVLAGSDKFSNENSFKPQKQNSNEIWRYKHQNLKINNNYFETIEKKLITKIISEKK